MLSFNKYVLPSAASLVTAMALAAPAAHALTAKTGQKQRPAAPGFTAKASGQIDRAVIGASNGKKSDYGFVDNVGSNSRFRFTGVEVMPDGVKVGLDYEMAFGVNESTNFDINKAGGPHNNVTNTRHAEAYLEGNFGKLSFGKGDGAANGASEVDLSGTEYLGGGSPHYYASGISFVNDNHVVKGANGNNVNIGNGAYNNYDALSRRNRVRYDTPSFNGAVLSASLDNGHAYEIAGRYDKTLANGTKIKAAVDWVNSGNTEFNVSPVGVRNGKKVQYHQYGGSASLLLPSGLNVTGMYKKRHQVGNSGKPDSHVYFAGLGYISGRNHFQVGYGHGRNLANSGSKGNSYEAAYVYDWSKGVQLYASYHLLTLNNVFDSTVGHKVNPNNINYLYIGTRIKFL